DEVIQTNEVAAVARRDSVDARADKLSALQKVKATSCRARRVEHAAGKYALEVFTLNSGTNSPAPTFTERRAVSRQNHLRLRIATQIVSDEQDRYQQALAMSRRKKRSYALQLPAQHELALGDQQFDVRRTFKFGIHQKTKCFETLARERVGFGIRVEHVPLSSRPCIQRADSDSLRARSARATTRRALRSISLSRESESSRRITSPRRRSAPDQTRTRNACSRPRSPINNRERPTIAARP